MMIEPPCICIFPSRHEPGCEWMKWKKAGKPNLAKSKPKTGYHEIDLKLIIIPAWQLAPGMEEIFQRLKSSIQIRGLLVPVHLRLHPNAMYEIVDGLKRVKVIEELGHETITALIL